ncbi:MAG: tautomerase family protein [Rhodocyclaceae bacterium]|nr:tautomerase family protein [Rhodocyclaceae bacterium]
MPVVQFHLIDTPANRDGAGRLLEGACALYAEVLAAPIERIRGFVTFHDPGHFLAAGALCSDNGRNAPFFEFIVLEGRSLAQRQRLLEGFTALLVETLAVEREAIRGCCRRVPPEDWGIGGVPASEKRRDEIAARAEAGAGKG